MTTSTQSEDQTLRFFNFCCPDYSTQKGLPSSFDEFQETLSKSYRIRSLASEEANNNPLSLKVTAFTKAMLDTIETTFPDTPIKEITGFAAQIGSVRMVEKISRENHVALHELITRDCYNTAAGAGSLEFIKHFIHKIPDSSELLILNNDGHIYSIPSYFAAANGQTETLSYIIDLRNLDPNSLFHTEVNGDTFYHEAARNGCVRGLTSLICFPDEFQMKLNSEILKKTTSCGKTAFHLAAMHGHANVMEHISKLPGFDIKIAVQPDSNGRNPFHITADYFGGVTVMEFISKLPGFKIEMVMQPDKNGKTPFHHTAYREHVNVMKFISKLPGFDIKIAMQPDKNGNTPLNYAKFGTYQKILQLIEEKTVS